MNKNTLVPLGVLVVVVLIGVLWLFLTANYSGQYEPASLRVLSATSGRRRGGMARLVHSTVADLAYKCGLSGHTKRVKTN